MTPRERMLKVLHRELPDRVPVVPGFGPWYATGTPAEIKADAQQAMEDAAEAGHFILGTGDQIGRDTPEANVIARVEAAHEYGGY